jgi:hypothetical protein
MQRPADTRIQLIRLFYRDGDNFILLQLNVTMTQRKNQRGRTFDGGGWTSSALSRRVELWRTSVGQCFPIEIGNEWKWCKTLNCDSSTSLATRDSIGEYINAATNQIHFNNRESVPKATIFDKRILDNNAERNPKHNYFSISTQTQLSRSDTIRLLGLFLSAN